MERAAQLRGTEPDAARRAHSEDSSPAEGGDGLRILPVAVKRPTGLLHWMLNMDSWTSWLADGGLELLEAALGHWLPSQRWFGAKARTIDSVRVLRWAEVALETGGAADADQKSLHRMPAVLLHAAVKYGDGEDDVYQLPLAMSTGRDAEKLAEDAPETVLARLEGAQDSAVVHEATVRDDVRKSLLALIARKLCCRCMLREMGRWMRDESRRTLALCLLPRRRMHRV